MSAPFLLVYMLAGFGRGAKNKALFSVRLGLSQTFTRTI